MTTPQHTPAAESGVAPDQWHRVHFITPLLDVWHIIATFIAIITFQNVDILLSLRDAIADGTFSIASVSVYIAVITAAGLLAIIIYTILAWKRMTFAIADDAVWLRKGLLMRTQRHARFDRIQAVDIIHPLLGRMFGLGKLHIEVAGGADSNVDIGYLKTTDLDTLRTHIAALAAGVAPTCETQQLPDEKTNVDLTPTTLHIEERPLYEVPTLRYIAALICSAQFIVPMFIIIAMLIGFTASRLYAGDWIIGGALMAIAPIALALVSFLGSSFSSDFGFRAFAATEGIRIQRGLFETRSQTIPPRRVHAIEISQPLLWRIPNWYRVRILQAGYVGETEKTTSDTLLPVGSRHEAELAMWLVIPDLGVQDPLTFIENALHGTNTQPDQHFTGIKPALRWIDWFSWKRRAFALTHTALVTRDGWLQHRLIVTPLERLQSISVHQGPLQRKLDAATIHLETVPGAMDTHARHIDATTAAQLLPEMLHMAQSRRQREETHTWVERISGDLIAFPHENTQENHA